MWTVTAHGPDGSGPKTAALGAALADTFFSRFMGLMFLPFFGPGDGLILRPCGAIHTWFMRFIIDAVFLDRENRVVDIARNLPPRRFFFPAGRTHTVIELPGGTLECCGIRIGDTVEMESGSH